jgi:hypothetical protein
MRDQTKRLAKSIIAKTNAIVQKHNIKVNSKQYKLTEQAKKSAERRRILERIEFEKRYKLEPYHNPHDDCRLARRGVCDIGLEEVSLFSPLKSSRRTSGI